MATNVSAVSGFPEWLPEVRIVEQRVLDAIRGAYELFGFAPLETPAVERLEVLTSKSGMQRQIYGLTRPDEDGEDARTSLGLHFDLTVPLARYVAQHADELVFPFRRYQMQKVWRGERAQRGRFREFTQCDVDIVGDHSLALAHDAEMPSVIDAAFTALGVPDFRVHVSNRKILGGAFSDAGLDGEHALRALRVVDKHGRGDEAATAAELAALGCGDDLVGRVTALVASTSIADAAKALTGSPSGLAGLDELAEVVDRAVALGMPPERLETDFSIARGLDYYTGTVYETFVTGREDWGSVCSGGRYDDLASAFTSRRHPGVGISIGLSRLLALLLDIGVVTPSAQTPTRVLVTMLDPEHHLDAYLDLARRLRAAGVPTEVALEPGSLRKQLAYASKKGIPLALIAGDREFSEGHVVLRDLDRQSQEPLPTDALVAAVTARLAAG